MTRAPLAPPIPELSIPAEDLLCVEISKLWVLWRDRGAEGGSRDRYLKELMFDDQAVSLNGWLNRLSGIDGDAWQRIELAIGAAPATELRSAPSAQEWDQLVSDERLRESASSCVATRARALFVVIDLCLWCPWAKGGRDFDRDQYRLDLRKIGAGLGGDVRRDEVDEIWAELRATARELSRRRFSRAAKAAIAATGLAAGALTGGLAAPAVGAAIGSSWGLAGAAATGAGLAALGGGSIAAGGFGMVGGTLLVQATAAAAGAGVSLGAGRLAEDLRGLTSDDYAVDLAQLIVITRRIVLKELDDDALAERILEYVNLLLEDHRGVQRSVGKPAEDHRRGIGKKIELLDRASVLTRDLIEGHRQ